MPFVHSPLTPRTTDTSPGLRAAASPAPEARSFAPPARGAQVSYPLETRSGRDLAVTLTLRTVVSLASGAPMAGQVVETLRLGSSARRLEPQERAALDLHDIERLDCEVYQRGMKLLEDANVEVGILPTSYRTLARTAGRFAYLSACLQAPLNGRSSIFAELIDVDAGTPRDRLIEVAALLGGHRRGVLLRLDQDPSTLEGLMSEVRVAGACIDGAGLEQPERWTRLRPYIRAVRSLTPTLVINDLDPSQRAAALEAGATHAVFRSYGALERVPI